MSTFVDRIPEIMIDTRGEALHKEIVSGLDAEKTGRMD
jgi:hypothetical protein